MAKETYFFSHDCNARNDERILMLRADHGMEGYGIYWALLEMMFETEETCLYHDKIKGIAVSYNIPISKLKDTIDTCINEGLFISNGNTFWSESLIRRKEKYHSLIQRRSDGGKKAMQNRWGDKSKHNNPDKIDITELKDSNNDDITKNNKGEKRKEEEKKKKKEKTFLSDSIEYRLADYLHKNILKINGNFKQPDIQDWSSHIDKMIRLDNRNTDEIKTVIDWVYKDDFWHKNILSTAKLRKQYDQLVVKMNDKNKPKAYRKERID